MTINYHVRTVTAGGHNEPCLVEGTERIFDITSRLVILVVGMMAALTVKTIQHCTYLSSQDGVFRHYQVHLKLRVDYEFGVVTAVNLYTVGLSHQTFTPMFRREIHQSHRRPRIFSG